MQIFLSIEGQTSTVDVDPAMTVAGLKELIDDTQFIPVELQRLVSGTTTLCTGTLEDSGLFAGSTVSMMFDVCGGGEASRYKKSTSCMRWKWKKKRTRRLQRKRRKMRQRAK